MSIVSIDDYRAIDNALDAAEESVTPFAVVTNDEIAVVGDANKTEINAHDYTMKFRVPEKKEDGSVGYKWITKEFKDVYITPRNDIKVNRMLMKLLPYYRKNEDGELHKYTAEEAMDIVDSFSDDLLDALYDTVACVLGIDKALAPYMDMASVLKAATQIIRDYPETVNEADTFFG